MKPRYVLALASFNQDSSDYNNNIYPEQGRIESPDYAPDKDIRHGLCGILWGKCRSRRWINSPERCKVLQVDNDDEVIIVDKYHNLVKFRSGLVVHDGDIESCGRFIASEVLNLCSSANMSFEDLAGYYSIADQGLTSVSEGFHSHLSTEGEAMHAIVTGDESEAITDKDCTISMAAGHNSRAVAVGDFSSSLVAAPNSRARACGDHSKSISLEDCSTVIASGASSYALALGLESRGAVGENGVLMLRWNDGCRDRIAIGYSGEDIQANTEYEVDETGNLIPVEKEQCG